MNKEVFMHNFHQQLEKIQPIPIDKILETDINFEIKSWLRDLFHFSYLSEYLSDSKTQEIIIHSKDKIICKQRDANLIVPCHLSQEELYFSFKNLIQSQDLNWNLKEPFVSFQYTFSFTLNNKKHLIQTRITLTHPELSPKNKFKAFIRVHRLDTFNLLNFTDDENVITILEYLVSNKRNLLVAGSTNSGKTSFLNTLLKTVPASEHLIILEDTDEIQTANEVHSKFLSNTELGYSLNFFCQYAMRMSPDRLILGEIRSSEVIPFLMNLNSGHKGGMATVHANSALEAIDRLVLLFKIYNQIEINYETIKKLLAQSIDYVVFLENKCITQIVKIIGADEKRCFHEIIYSRKSISILN
jgi:type IV secretion system protein VirB11